jgi:hypothetical protein
MAGTLAVERFVGGALNACEGHPRADPQAPAVHPFPPLLSDWQARQVQSSQQQYTSMISCLGNKS